MYAHTLFLMHVLIMANLKKLRPFQSLELMVTMILWMMEYTINHCSKKSCESPSKEGLARLILFKVHMKPWPCSNTTAATYLAILLWLPVEKDTCWIFHFHKKLNSLVIFVLIRSTVHLKSCLRSESTPRAMVVVWTHRIVL